jgi:hypothetical protein
MVSSGSAAEETFQIDGHFQCRRIGREVEREEPGMHGYIDSGEGATVSAGGANKIIE